MVCAKTVRLLFFLAAFLAFAAPSGEVIIPAGTEIQLRLTNEVSSEKPSGQPVSAVVIAPVIVNGSVAIGFGATLSGTTAGAQPNQPAVNGSSEKPATLRIELTKIQDKSGQSKTISCVLEGVDNARESIDQSGLITGITASHTFTSLADKGVAKVASKYEQLGQILSAIKTSTVKEADPSIDYKPGVEFTIKLTKPLDWTPPKDASIPGTITPLDALSALVNQQPYRTVAQKLSTPSDITNLMFIGTKDALESALKEAGWFAADQLGRSSTFRTAQAIIESRGYAEAPMSLLTLNGNPPDMTFEKQNNTFAARHHMRVWQIAQTFNGKPVFVASSTHDTRIYFSDTTKSITHGIDPNIDKERTKVVNDMLFTGRVQATALIDRPNIPKGISNASGDQLQTDNKMAVVELKAK
jgi:LssY-like putative type I secretion system component LssY